MKTLGYYNGTFDEVDNMTIPMNDRVSWFGDGVYEATYAGNYHISRWTSTLIVCTTAQV